MQLNITEQDFDVIWAGVGKLPIENAWPVFVKLQDHARQHLAAKQSMEAAQQAGLDKKVDPPVKPRNKGGRPRKVPPTVNGSAGEPAQVTG